MFGKGKDMLASMMSRKMLKAGLPMVQKGINGLFAMAEEFPLEEGEAQVGALAMKFKGSLKILVVTIAEDGMSFMRVLKVIDLSEILATGNLDDFDFSKIGIKESDVEDMMQKATDDDDEE
ncbi:hypothetical protein [Phaeocystidibacter luteus]|uniref:Uncharacterized protein n=1 Tax=Phaeocystidibacter luteus TaxID=911197 RepID=A0A6N6RLY7_9FLAO|nr:hypothetical protein [Phaeocystidibacter luteus]KAB2814572.1 hypothetical protein F8C67_02195 [Phaeocystidibacter luteus]